MTIKEQVAVSQTEREQIVAWLHTLPLDLNPRQERNAYLALLLAAKAIERGDHIRSLTDRK